MSLRHTAAALVLITPLAAGCGDAGAAKAQEEVAALQERVRQLEASVLQDEVLLSDLKNAATEKDDSIRSLEKAAEAHGEELQAANAEAADARRSKADLEGRIKTLEAENEEREGDAALLKETAAHRDELIEWIEQDLLPIAEAQDPRLANLKRAAEDMSREVETLRGLSFKRSFMRRLVRREQVGEWMKRDLEKELPKEEAEKLVRVGAELGLVAPGTDLYELFSGFLEGGAAAFYKPQTNTFYLIEGAEGAGARPIVFHELIHAVEDQYFELDKIYRDLKDDSDRALAARGLIEGSAEFFTNRYGADHPDEVQAMMRDQMKMAAKQMKMVREMPPFLIASIGLYPYKNGAAWLKGLGVKDGDDIQRLFADMPVSTEQVLHPEKFPLDGGARDYPHLVLAPEIAGILGKDWEEVGKDSMGELMTGLLLAQLSHDAYFPAFVSILDQATSGVSFKGDVKVAVEGWDGDRYSAYIRTGSEDVCMVWVLFWDSSADADEFARTYGKLLAKRETGEKPDMVTLPARWTRENGSVSALERDGKRVVVVLGAPSEHVDALVKAGHTAEITPDERDPSDKR